MACRFPGKANDPASYWRLLCDGIDAIGEIPPDRWNVDEYYDPDPAAPGKMSTRWGGFLERIDQFDNHFFTISDREAARIDPQQRILLELAWEALEDAGLPPSTLRGSKTGVFIGISLSEYGLMLSSDLALTDAHAAAGTSLCLAANRLSFAFGLQGPSMALDTACSSSLVAVHLACQNIRDGQCDAALAGGVNLLLSPIGTVNLTKAGFCASDGRVRAFDAAATGYVRSEGAGVVVLKPLSAALNNNDPIYAVIRGSAVNQNGTSNGLTAPSRAAQEQVLREAYARASVSPGEVQFVETQGTGTRLGDTIEATALGSVLARGSAGRQPLRHRRGEDKHWPPRSGLRHRQPDEGGLGAQAQADTGEPELPIAQSRHSVRGPAAAGAAASRTLARHGPAASGRRQCLRLWRQQRPHGFGGAAGGRSGAGLRRRRTSLFLAAAFRPHRKRDCAILLTGMPMSWPMIRRLGATCAIRPRPVANTTIAAWRCWPIRPSRRPNSCGHSRTASRLVTSLSDASPLAGH